MVTNHDYSESLPHCLESMSLQEYDAWRCVVVDDASTDDSVKVINDFIRDITDRFSLVKLESNRGGNSTVRIRHFRSSAYLKPQRRSNAIRRMKS